MFKLVLFSLAIACPHLSSAKRVNKENIHKLLKTEVEESANATTAWDILMCDTMCMQCPGGRNILIQRQKGTVRGAISVGAGLLSFGLAMPVVNQLAGCNKIGFEFWHNQELEEEQPLRTEAHFGLFVTKSGLEKIEEEFKWSTHPEDVKAIQFCHQLTDPFLWQAVRGAWGGLSGHDQQQEFARRCLSHSALCGSDAKWELTDGMEGSELRTDRFNPFADGGMCSPPNEDGESADGAANGGSPANGDDDIPQAIDIMTDAALSADTVAAAGKLLGELTDASDDFFGLSDQDSSDNADDALVGKVAHQLCHSAEQEGRCKKLGIQDEACKDRCCLDVCRFYSTKPSCVNTCVKKS